MNWETFDTVLGYISGPLIGAVIGYITNFIAVKMLFHPYNPIKIFGFALPFTPGIIPKRKNKLAEAIGNAVGNSLFTENDLNKMLTSEDVKNKVSSSVCEKVKELSDLSPERLLCSVTTEEGAKDAKETAISFITDKVMEGSAETDLGSLIAEQGFNVIKEKKSSLGMIGMFITDDLIINLLDQLKTKVNEYIELDGRILVEQKVREKAEDVFVSPISSLVDPSLINTSVAKDKIGNIYSELVKSTLDAVSDDIDISGIVKEKVDRMSVKELENLCMSVMKRELGAVINLGALIGFVIGIINIFI